MGGRLERVMKEGAEDDGSDWLKNWNWRRCCRDGCGPVLRLFVPCCLVALTNPPQADRRYVRVGGEQVQYITLLYRFGGANSIWGLWRQSNGYDGNSRWWETGSKRDKQMLLTWIPS